MLVGGKVRERQFIRMPLDKGSSIVRFYTTEWNTKRHARRLKKALRQHSYEMPYTRCLDLMARLYGFSHFSELKNTVSKAILSPLDDDVDDEALEARFQHQERVMAEAGFADIAGAVLDQVEPTGRGNGAVFLNEAIDARPD
jgi:hypothetical protein